MLQMPVNLSDLHDYRRLNELAKSFDDFVNTRHAALFERFNTYRREMQSGVAHGGLTEPQESALLIEVSRPLGEFLATLFGTDEAPVRARAERDAEVAR